MRNKPYGLTEADMREPYANIIPDRVKKLIEIHHRNHIEYNWQEEDKQEQYCHE